MRIAYVCADPGIPVFGSKGCSIHVQEVLRSLVGLGHDVTLFAARTGGDPPEALSHVEVWRVPALAGATGASREAAAVSRNHRLESLLYLHGPFDLVYERYSLWSYAGMSYAGATSTASLLEVNAPLVAEQEKHRVLHNKPLAESIARTVFGLAGGILAVSEETASYVRRVAGSSVPVCVVANGFSPTRFARFGKPTSLYSVQAFTIGFVGSLKPWHGLEVLIDAAAEVRRTHDVRLLIVGEGPERTAIERRVDDLGLAESTTVTGAVPYDSIPKYLQQMDVGTAPYTNGEGFYFSPLKVVEYMAAAVCPVVSATGQLRTLVKNGFNGLHVQPGSAHDLARQLRFANDNQDAVLRMAAQARDDISGQTWDAVVKRSLDFGAEQATVRLKRLVAS